jgi:hypothetical protein
MALRPIRRSNRQTRENGVSVRTLTRIRDAHHRLSSVIDGWELAARQADE